MFTTKRLFFFLYGKFSIFGCNGNVYIYQLVRFERIYNNASDFNDHNLESRGVIEKLLHQEFLIPFS